LNSTARHFTVILLSFVLVGGSGLVTYGAWSLFSGLGTLERAVASLASWVASFYLGSILFWKTILVVSRYS